MHLNKKDFAICFSAAFAFFLPLMMAGVYYRDDLDRATTGYFGWSALGRPFADLILVLLSSSSTHAVNLFPLSIVYTAVFIALAAYFLGCYLKRSGEVNYRLISAMIIFNPFYLQNVAYRFDSIGMSLAFALSVFSFCFFSKSIAVKYIVSVISLILALSTYQTCTNVFIALIGFEVLISLKNRTYTDVFKIVASRCLVFVTAYAVYLLSISKIFASGNSRAETISFGDLDLLGNTLSRLNHFVLSYFEGLNLIYFAIALLLGMVVYFTKNIKTGAFKITLSIFIVFLSLYVSLLGPAVLLKSAPIAPRTLVSFSMIFVVITYMLSHVNITRFIAFLPVISVFAFSANVANAMKLQRDYEQVVFSGVKNDLRNINDIKDVRFVGTVNYSPMTSRIVSGRKVYEPFVSRASEWIAAFQLNEMGVKNVYLGYGKDRYNRELLRSIKSKPFAKNDDYSIFFDGKTAVIVLGDGR
ncbi:glucosyltransferase domain-containing protein [Enterobacter hormaechei]|uniref:glucosyltransferase domain-containing protein n=2 Tax=Enterobacter hormaechei TaxID=158836 RepID=UPI000735566A|nr:glucosyltransferase domain-containing protein [Enterobacter hormaechei]KTI22218.1 hypothetical protein ASV10_01950 [Enterobacter hormaechei subsp. xiangfangensis]KTJ14972.1 hypothetical protein ASU90_03545 [Enterobacter hormaechei subsp. xiangfangensis]MBN7889167.1 glucosyltransferase domain-containing protein [Enterobacter hormaechei]CZU76985.1 Uncharacterised protein [Enterobacter hormaechei]CZW77627.1 Uncharacterised protein [Enterobacter hormaechei]